MISQLPHGKTLPMPSRAEIYEREYASMSITLSIITFLSTDDVVGGRCHVPCLLPCHVGLLRLVESLQ
jgi:hypothetical protein